MQNVYAGSLRLKAGWYLDTTVELKGLKQKVGVFDGDSNLRLGDVAKPQTYRNTGEEETWYFGPADTLLVDVDGSGAFERDTFNTESRPFGPLLYFGATPYKVALAPDRTSLRVEPWTEALAEVALLPHGDQVHGVELAWERPEPAMAAYPPRRGRGQDLGAAGQLPVILVRTAGQGRAARPGDGCSHEELLKKPFSFVAGQANTLRCGPPLEIKVTAKKRKPEPWELNNGDLRNPPLASDSEFILSINGNVRGADGEVYASYAKGEKFSAEPPPPTFTIARRQRQKGGQRQPGVWLRGHLLVLMASTQNPGWRESHRQRRVRPEAAADDQQAHRGPALRL